MFIWEEGTSAEELQPSDWLVGVSGGNYLDWEEMGPLWVELSLGKKARAAQGS